MANWQIFFLHSIFFYHPSRQLKYSLPSSAPPKLQKAGLKKKKKITHRPPIVEDKRGEGEREMRLERTHTQWPPQ